MPTDLRAQPAPAPVHSASPAQPAPPRLETGNGLVVVRRRSPRQALLDAERRGAPDHELRLLAEAAIAASIARVREAARRGHALTLAERHRCERDRELLRRFPEDRRGINGEGWFHLS